MKSNIRPIDLRRMAAAIARSHGASGAIVITYGPEGIRVGAGNLTPEEMREALCVAVHYSFRLEASSASSDAD